MRTAAPFWSRVDRSAGPDACWPWLGAKDWDGYGKVRHGGRQRQAHRVAAHLANGAPLEGGDALHACDRPDCVNPSHITIGTHGDNMRDRSRKGRDNRNRLTATQVVEVIEATRDRREPWLVLAARFGVSARRLRQIAQRAHGPKAARCLGERARRAA